MEEKSGTVAPRGLPEASDTLPKRTPFQKPLSSEL